MPSNTDQIGRDIRHAGMGVALARETGSMRPGTFVNEDKYRPYGPAGGVDSRARAYNASTAERNFTQGLEGGRWSDDTYERAQQQRNFHQNSDFKKYNAGLDPGSQLQERLGSEAYGFRTGLIDTQNNSAESIRGQAGGQLDRGLKTLRSGASSRGLLYSGLRQGAEQDLRGRVANTMASQIAGSNRDLSKRADSMDEVAANAKLQGRQATMQAQADSDRMSRENDVMRAQQMQQLGGAIGYGFGRYMGGNKDDGPQNPNVVSTNRYSNESY